MTPLVPGQDSSPPMTPGNRPTETAAGVTGSVAGALAVLIGIDDPNKVAALVVLLGWLPYGVTWIVHLRRRS